VDGGLPKVRFDSPVELMFLTNQVLIVVDEDNFRLQIVNLRTHTVSSVCNGEAESVTVSDGTDCSLDDPRAITLVGSSPYIGENHAIRQVDIIGQM